MLINKREEVCEISNLVRLSSIMLFIRLKPLSHSAVLHGITSMEFTRGFSSVGIFRPILSR